MLGIGVVVIRVGFLYRVPIRKIVFCLFLSSQIVDAAVDADTVDPGGEAGVVFCLIFVQEAVCFDECLLQDVLGVFGIFRVLKSQREDSLSVVFKKHAECLRIALLGRLYNSSFVHLLIFHLSKRKLDLFG